MKILFILALCLTSTSLFAQSQSTKTDYDLFAKTYAEVDKIPVENKDDFIKAMDKYECIECSVYFSGANFKEVEKFNLNNRKFSSMTELLSKISAGTNLTLDNCKIKQPNGEIISDFKKTIFFY